ncbi:MAG: hypothetical protein WBD20_22585 [Pirellulaceae bacterium]
MEITRPILLLLLVSSFSQLARGDEFDNLSAIRLSDDDIETTYVFSSKETNCDLLVTEQNAKDGFVEIHAMELRLDMRDGSRIASFFRDPSTDRLLQDRVQVEVHDRVPVGGRRTVSLRASGPVAPPRFGGIYVDRNSDGRVDYGRSYLTGNHFIFFANEIRNIRSSRMMGVTATGLDGSKFQLKKAGWHQVEFFKVDLHTSNLRDGHEANDGTGGQWVSDPAWVKKGSEFRREIRSETSRDSGTTTVTFTTIQGHRISILSGPTLLRATIEGRGFVERVYHHSKPEFSFSLGGPNYSDLNADGLVDYVTNGETSAIRLPSGKFAKISSSSLERRTAKSGTDEFLFTFGDWILQKR